MKSGYKPIRKLLVNIYPMDEWLLAALGLATGSRRRRGRSGQDAKTIRRALMLAASLQGIRPPDSLIAEMKTNKINSGVKRQ